jgi:hypothetical protein
MATSIESEFRSMPHGLSEAMAVAIAMREL